MQQQPAKQEPRLSNSPWFPHDIDSTTDSKIGAMLSDWGAAGYGLYWRIIELMHADPLGLLDDKMYTYKSIASLLRVPVNDVQLFVTQAIEDYDLFIRTQVGEDLFFTSNRVQRNKDRKEFVRQKRAEAGRLGGKQRQANAKQMLANAKQDQANVKQNQAEERRVDKNIYLSTLLSTTSTDIITCLGGPATNERLYGAFVSAYPRAFTEDAKKWLSEFWKGLSEEKAREVTENLAIDLDTKGADWKDFDNLTAYVDY